MFDTDNGSYFCLGDRGARFDADVREAHNDDRNTSDVWSDHSAAFASIASTDPDPMWRRLASGATVLAHLPATA